MLVMLVGCANRSGRKVSGHRYAQDDAKLIQRELIDRCRLGDRKAQHEIYAQTAERVYRLALRITGHAEDAFDVAQETYVRAFTRLAQFDGRSSFYTWLCRIAVNEALQLQRRAGARAGYESAAAVAVTGQTDGPASDAQLDIEAGLAGLPSADRTILLLRYQDGLDYQTIAEITDCEPGTVGSRLNRARERLRDFLKNGYASGEESAVPEHPIERGKGEGTAPDRNASKAGVRRGAGQ